MRILALNLLSHLGNNCFLNSFKIFWIVESHPAVFRDYGSPGFVFKDHSIHGRLRDSHPEVLEIKPWIGSMQGKSHTCYTFWSYFCVILYLIKLMLKFMCIHTLNLCIFTHKHRNIIYN